MAISGKFRGEKPFFDTKITDDFLYF
jgi:hypothetical protein